MTDLWLEVGRSLSAHRVRFALTAVGIAWGTLVLTFLSSLMVGFQSHFVSELEELGPNIVIMGPAAILESGRGERYAREPRVEPRDVARVERSGRVSHASPEVQRWAVPVRVDGRSKLLSVTGLDADGDRIRSIVIDRGRFLSPLDVERAAKVAVLGPEAARRLFGRKDPVDRAITVDGHLFRVIGLATAKGDQLVNSVDPDDRKLFIPYTTAQRWFSRTKRLTEFSLAPANSDRSGETIRRVRELTALRERYAPSLESALWAFDIQEPLALVRTLFLGIRVFMAGAGLVTLFVGAVGVMNIMLVVVGERRQEIGLRKAVGAHDRDIFLQFVAEASIVSLGAGVAGTGVGLGLVRGLAAWLPEDATFQSPPIFDLSLVVPLTLALVIVGSVSGLMPALRAARIPPSVALRSA